MIDNAQTPESICLTDSFAITQFNDARASTVKLAQGAEAIDNGGTTVPPSNPHRHNQQSGFNEATNFSLTAAAVPEPTTVLLLGVGFVGLAAVRRKRVKKLA